MVLTSQSFNVSAAMQDSLLAPEDTVISTEIADPALAEEELPEISPEETELSETLDEGTSVDVLIGEDVIEEGAEVLSGPEETVDTDVVESTAVETETPEGEDIPASQYLTVKTVNGRNELCLRYPGTPLSDQVPVATSFTIPKNVDYIPKDSNLFYNNQKVLSIDFQDIVSDNLVIAEGAFENSSIKGFYASEKYKTISANTFKDCTNLVAFDFKDIETISSNAFEGCTSFGSGDNITWTNKITTIGDGAFKNTGFEILNLNSIIDGTDIVKIGSHAFENCSKLKQVTVPFNVNYIPEYAFSGCSNLTTITVNASTAGTVVGSYAFKDCISIKNLGGTPSATNKGESFKVVELKPNAFIGCTGLTTMVFPNELHTVGAKAFDNCNKITDVEFHYHNASDWADDVLKIADDAFTGTARNNTTIKGYDGVVEQYSNNNNFKKFVSLITAHTIKGNDASGRFNAGASLTTDQPNNKAKPRTKVTMTVTPKDPYRVRRNDLYDINGGLNANDIKFVSGDDKKQVFEFIMPFNDVVIDASALGFYKDEQIKDATTSVTIVKYEDKEMFREIEGGVWRANHPGYMGQIYIDASKGGNNYKLGQWMFEYKSSNENIVKVDARGVITSIGEGDATITATYRGTGLKAVTIPINVGPAVDITKLTIDPKNPAQGITIGAENNKTIDGVKYDSVPVITIDQTYLRSGSKDVELELLATADGSTTSYVVKADWIIGDDVIAAIKNKTTNDNKNTLTIKKGVSGDTYVRASHNTYRKDKDDKDIILYAYLLVRVVDITPRVNVDEVIIDTNCDAGWNANANVTGGTPISLIAANGYTINDDYVLDFYRGANSNSLTPYNGLIVKKTTQTEDHNYRIIFNPQGSDSGLGAASSAGKSKTYSGNNKLWIHGRQKDGNNIETDFYSPINKLTIKNEQIKLAAVASGQINLLYSNNCYYPIPYGAAKADDVNIAGCYDELPRKDSEKYDQDGNTSYIDRYVAATVGKVIYTNNISYETAEVFGVSLWDQDHYKAWSRKEAGYTDDGAVPAGVTDKLANNFNIGLLTRDGSYDRDFIVTRSDKPLATNRVNDKDIDVVKGYIAVYFKGHSKPVFQAVVIPTKVTYPSYALSETSITENSKITSGVFRFKIMDSAKKKVMASDKTIEKVELDMTQGSVFTKVENSGEDIVLTASAGRLTGKKTAIVKVTKKNWCKPATYKYSVNYVEKEPAAKLKNSSVKLNRWYPGQNVETELALNQANCTLSLLGGFTYSGSDKLAADAGKIKLTATPVLNYQNKFTIKAEFVNATNLPMKGTYKFSFTPRYTYGAGTPVSLKPMTINVQVLDNQPTLRLGASTYIFNMDYQGLENKEVTAAFGNLPAGVELKDIVIDTSTAKWTLYKSAKDADVEKIVGGKIAITREYNEAKKKWFMTFKLNDTGLKNRDFTITYDLSDITVNGTKIKPIRLTVKGINKEPTVSVSKRGNLNCIDYVTPVKYTAKFANLTGPEYSGIDVIGLSDNKVSAFLKAERDNTDNKITNITLIPGAEMPNKNYEFQLVYRFKAGDLQNDNLAVYTKKITLKPVQRTPKLRFILDNNSRLKKAVFFSGVKGDDREVSVDLTKTSEFKTRITKVKIKDSNAAILRSAFEVDYSKLTAYVAGSGEETLPIAINTYANLSAKTKQLYTGEIKIKCTNPELLKAGKVYKLVLETEFDGQFYKTDKNGNYVLDANGNRIKINGSTITVPVVVYK